MFDERQRCRSQIQSHDLGSRDPLNLGRESALALNDIVSRIRALHGWTNHGCWSCLSMRISSRRVLEQHDNSFALLPEEDVWGCARIDGD